MQNLESTIYRVIVIVVHSRRKHGRLPTFRSFGGDAGPRGSGESGQAHGQSNLGPRALNSICNATLFPSREMLSLGVFSRCIQSVGASPYVRSPVDSAHRGSASYTGLLYLCMHEPPIISRMRLAPSLLCAAPGEIDAS